MKTRKKIGFVLFCFTSTYRSVASLSVASRSVAGLESEVTLDSWSGSDVGVG